MSWADYVRGMRHLGRHHARASLRLYHAFTVANAAKDEDRNDWTARQRAVARW